MTSFHPHTIPPNLLESSIKSVGIFWRPGHSIWPCPCPGDRGHGPYQYFHTPLFKVSFSQTLFALETEQLDQWGVGGPFHLFIQQILVTHLLCARHWVMCWGSVVNKTKLSPSQSFQARQGATLDVISPTLQDIGSGLYCPRRPWVTWDLVQNKERHDLMPRERIPPNSLP